MRRKYSHVDLFGSAINKEEIRRFESWKISYKIGDRTITDADWIDYLNFVAGTRGLKSAKNAWMALQSDARMDSQLDLVRSLAVQQTMRDLCSTAKKTRSHRSRNATVKTFIQNGHPGSDLGFLTIDIDDIKSALNSDDQHVFDTIFSFEDRGIGASDLMVELEHQGHPIKTSVSPHRTLTESLTRINLRARTLGEPLDIIVTPPGKPGHYGIRKQRLAA